MVKRMLIEATHPEETRVVVLDGTRLEEFDVETSTKKQIKGNIYLAKVVRVEPSLQAAFVDYGGNRHGFLAFSEIHPDYYQIPVADRERLIAEAQRHEEEEERRRENQRAARATREAARTASGDNAGQAANADASMPHDDHEHEHGHDHHDHENHDHENHGHDDHTHHDHDHDDHGQPDHTHDDHAHDDHAHDDHGDAIPLAFIPPAITSPISDDDSHDEHDHDEHGHDDSVTEAGFVKIDSTEEHAAFTPDVPETVGGEPSEDASGGAGAARETAEDSHGEVQAKRDAKTAGVETVGGEEDEDDEAAEEKQRHRFVASRHYKIQEVIKRRQIMLVQVVKEERGNKGAALTTFLSLAGRYCVLMPNSPRGGGVSRKITSAQDRRRLKAILGDLELPKNMAVILRTAGAERNKAEIKRDYEYLQRTWNNIREVTMTSRAPAPIHEEASLIKRAIRDIYSRDIEEVWVEGEEGYKVGKDFMKMLTPSHAKKVQRYKDDIIPLFHRYQVESQMEAINSPTVQLRSGGSIVFAQTEALVAIDVNSGRATKERHIEETAYKTNCEAADEIARQLRLRDLAGLIVIDFIDMEDNRNNHSVERRLKEALKADRARIQVGRISHFGLLELSRQRLRPSLIEANFRVCSHCAGSGMVRSTESAAVYSLRMMEEEGVRQRSSEITVTVHPDVALYLLNYKRDSLASIETRYSLKIIVMGDASLVPPNIRLDRVKAVRQIGDDAGETAPREAPRELERPTIEAPDEDTSDADEADAPPPRQSEHRGRDRNRDRDRDRNRNSNSNREEGGREQGAREEAAREEGGGEAGGRKRRRRRRRRGGGRDGEIAPAPGAAPVELGAENSSPQEAPTDGGDENGAEAGENHNDGRDQGNQGPGRDDASRRGRRRGRRGGRRRRRGGEPHENGGQANAGAHNGETHEQGQSQQSERAENDAPAYVAATAETARVEGAHVEGDGAGGNSGESGPSRFFRAIKDTWRRNDSNDGATETASEPAPPAPTPAPAAPPPPPAASNEPSQPAKRGWWNKDET